MRIQPSSLLELLSTIIRGREQSDQESAAHGKIALANELKWAITVTSTSDYRVARTSTWRTDHPARGREPLRKLFLFSTENFSFRALIPTMIRWISKINSQDPVSRKMGLEMVIWIQIGIPKEGSETKRPKRTMHCHQQYGAKYGQILILSVLKCVPVCQLYFCVQNFVDWLMLLLLPHKK